MTILIYLVIALIAAIAGVAGTIVYQKKALNGKAAQILKDAEAEGEVVKKEKMLQAKEKSPLFLKKEDFNIILFRMYYGRNSKNKTNPLLVRIY